MTPGCGEGQVVTKGQSLSWLPVVPQCRVRSHHKGQILGFAFRKEQFDVTHNFQDTEEPGLVQEVGDRGVCRGTDLGGVQGHPDRGHDQIVSGTLPRR